MVSNEYNIGTLHIKENKNTDLEYEPDEDKTNCQFNTKIRGKGEDDERRVK
jgi:hypothetical protein